MKTLVFDNSFEGFLCCIYEVYDKKLDEVIISDEEQFVEKLFSEKILIVTNMELAVRVMKGIVNQSSPKIFRFIYSVFLSESTKVYNCLLYFIKCIFRGESYRITDYGDEKILNLHKAKKMIRREVHRMHAFVRFQQTKDDIYAAIINPDFNVLPLTWKHFKERYPAMDWMLYDVKRAYGIFYSRGTIKTLTYPKGIELNGTRIAKDKLTDDETHYQKMWQAYFQSVNISERNNAKLHEKHVPRRYWSYLVEKW